MPSLSRMPSLAFGKIFKRGDRSSSDLSSQSGYSTPSSSQRYSSSPLPSSIRETNSIVTPSRSVSGGPNPVNVRPDMSLGSKPVPRPKHQTITPRELRDLRELIIQRYSLDFDLYMVRDSRYAKEDVVVQDKIRIANGTLKKINNIIKAWDKREFWETEEDWNKWKDIKRRLLEPGKRDWQKYPPWIEKGL